MEVTLERLDQPEDVGIIVDSPEISLARPEFVIGRAGDCQLQIPSRFVSRHHCELIVDERDRHVRIRDLGSQNGTYVNEAPVDECELKNGDRLRVACIPFEIRIGSAK